jgi:quercetin dioxygenase-like cupin family protein
VLRLDFATVEEQTVTRADAIGEQYNRHLLSAVATGTSDIVADLVRLPPGFVHKLHRHPHADQVLVVLSGTLIAFDVDGELELGPLTAVLFRRDEWHGARTSDAEATGLNLFCGVGAAADAGYEEGPAD